MLELYGPNIAAARAVLHFRRHASLGLVGSRWRDGSHRAPVRFTVPRRIGPSHAHPSPRPVPRISRIPGPLSGQPRERSDGAIGAD